jgi:transposase
MPATPRGPGLLVPPAGELEEDSGVLRGPCTCGSRTGQSNSWLNLSFVVISGKGLALKLHANAQTCPHCRSLIVSRVLAGQPVASVARDFQVSPKTVLKWIARFRAQGRAGLDDRSSRPHHIARRHLQPGNELNDAVFALLHTPPKDSSFNRTTWRLADLHSALKKQEVLTSRSNLSIVIRRAGY